MNIEEFGDLKYDPAPAAGSIKVLRASICGLSTETKPTCYAIGSTFLEVDTGSVYVYTGSSNWRVFMSGSSVKLQEKTTTVNGVVLPDSGYDGLSKVTVNVSGGGVYQSKTVDASHEEQTIKPDSGYDALSEVVVRKVDAEELTVTANGNYDRGDDDKFYSKVYVNVAGGGTYQEKSITPGNDMVEVTPDVGYDALSKVTVDKVDAEDLEVTANGTYDPQQGGMYPNKYYKTVTVSVPSSGGVTFADAMLNGVSKISVDASFTIPSDCTNIKGAYLTDGMNDYGNIYYDDMSKLTNIYESAPQSNYVISKGAFAGASNLTGISLSFCTDIGEKAFSECSTINLAQFTSCTSIGDSAFYKCQEISSVNLPLVQKIGSYAFYVEYKSEEGTSGKLTSLSLPACTDLGSEAFFGHMEMTSISCPELVTLGDGAFESCGMTTVTLEKCTSNSGGHGFKDCDKLASIYLPEILNVGYYMFERCSSLVTVSIPKATIIEECGFVNCSVLETLSLPSVTTVEKQAFRECTMLKSVSLPSATSIAEEAFMGCYALETVDIKKCTSIASNVFYYTDKLQTIDLSEVTEVTTIESDSFGGMVPSGVTVKVPSALLTAFGSASNWSQLVMDGTVVFQGV